MNVVEISAAAEDCFGQAKSTYACLAAQGSMDDYGVRTVLLTHAQDAERLAKTAGDLLQGADPEKGDAALLRTALYDASDARSLFYRAATLAADLAPRR